MIRVHRPNGSIRSVGPASWLAAVLVVSVFAITATACSSPSRSGASGGSPSATTAATASSAVDANFDNAVDFTRDVQHSNYWAAEEFASPKSAATRYIQSQQAITRAEEAGGEHPTTDDVGTISPRSGYAVDPH